MAVLAAIAQYPVYAVLARRPLSRNRRQVLLFLAVVHVVVGGAMVWATLAG